MSTVSISIILITYNRVDFLKKYLPRILPLIEGDDELIIINNNSSDGTATFLESLNIMNVKKIFVGKQGLNVCRNIALRIARHPYLAFIDDDAYPDVTWLSAFRSAVAKHLDAVIFAGRTLLNFQSHRPIFVSKKYYYLWGEKDYGEDDVILTHRQSPGGGNMVVNKLKMKEVGFFNESFDRKGSSLLSNGETEIVRRIYQRGFLIVYVPQAIIYHWVGDERIEKRWLLRRMYWQGISDGLLARKHQQLIRFVGIRLGSQIIKIPLECVMMSKFIQVFFFSLLLELSKTLGILIMLVKEDIYE